MTQPAPDKTTLDCTFDTIVGFLLPFYLAAAAGNRDIVRGVIKGLVEAYNVSTPTELDLVGRIIGCSTAAMDNLRLSTAAGLSDTKVLRYRCNAVSLSRASDNARTILEAVQAKQEQTRKIPRPSVAAAPSTKTRLPSTVAASNPQRSAPLSRNTEVAEFPMDIEGMKRDARIMMAAFSKSGGHASTAIPAMPDIDAAIDAAARAAVAHAPVTPSRRIATG